MQTTTADTEKPSTDHPATTIGTVGLEVAPSWLSNRLADGGHAGSRRAFALAREQFIDGRRIDMSALATDLGVDRTSLFRWVGNRDALLSEVLWSLAAPTLLQAEEATSELRAEERVAGVLTHFVDAHRIRGLVHEAFPLERVQEAHRAFAAPGLRGKIVVTMAP